MLQHGKVYTYRKGCKCDLCMAAVKEAYTRQRRARGVNPRGCPCAVGDEVFPSIKAAALHLKVSRNTIYTHLDTYGDLSVLLAKKKLVAAE